MVSYPFPLGRDLGNKCERQGSRDGALGEEHLSLLRRFSMKQFRFLPLIILMALISGCATMGRSTADYNQPPARQVGNKIVVKKPFSQVWDKLVKGLAKSFYVINNIEKESRIINISFSSNSPENYINCGRTIRTYEKGMESKRYEYDVAASSNFKVARGKAGQYGQYLVTQYVNRITSLEGRVNIYVAPDQEKRRTQLSVNTRYILTVDISGYSSVQNALAVELNREVFTPRKYTHTFNTNQPNRINWGTMTSSHNATCNSTGQLEYDILELAK